MEKKYPVEYDGWFKHLKGWHVEREFDLVCLSERQRSGPVGRSYTEVDLSSLQRRDFLGPELPEHDNDGRSVPRLCSQETCRCQDLQVALLHIAPSLPDGVRLGIRCY